MTCSGWQMKKYTVNLWLLGRHDPVCNPSDHHGHHDHDSIFLIQVNASAKRREPDAASRSIFGQIVASNMTLDEA